MNAKNAHPPVDNLISHPKGSEMDMDFRPKRGYFRLRFQMWAERQRKNGGILKNGAKNGAIIQKERRLRR